MQKTHEGTFCADGNGFYLDNCGGYLDGYIFQNASKCTLKMAYFILQH